MKRIEPIILAPLIAHPIWAVLMLTAPIPIHTIGIDAAYKVTPGPLSASLLMLVASIGAWCSHLDRYHGRWQGFALIATQQFLMLLTLWTVCVSVVSATYANNYSPPEGWRFIAADQIFFSVCSVLHTVAVWRIYISHHDR